MAPPSLRRWPVLAVCLLVLASQYATGSANTVVDRNLAEDEAAPEPKPKKSSSIIPTAGTADLYAGVGDVDPDGACRHGWPDHLSSSWAR